VAFSYAPVRFATLIGLALGFLGMLYAALIIVNRILFGIDAEGWSSLMVVLLVVSGAQMFMIGILGEYLWRTLDETRRRPRFIVERVIQRDREPSAEKLSASEGDQ
jgi:hypothetical protein